jgi:NTE family protein
MTGALARLLASTAAAIVLCGCAGTYNKVSNVAWTPGTPVEIPFGADLMGENSIVLAFSGGGLRAAAFTHGTLLALQGIRTPDGDLLDDVAVISSVSGSSLASAYYGLYGREGLGRFREEVLLPGFESGLRLSLLSPANLSRLCRVASTSGRTSATCSTAKSSTVRRSRTSIGTRARPSASTRQTCTTGCPSRSSRRLRDPVQRHHALSVADAVAASMAVPLVFAPIVVRTYPESCPPLPRELESLHILAETSHSLQAIDRARSAYRDGHVRYIKLADGGLTDNYGVSLITNARLIYGTPYAPMSARDAVRIRRLLVIVADASRGPGGDWIDREDGPGGFDLALSATDAAVDSAARLAADEFDTMIGEWERSVASFRCALSPDEAARLGAPARWDCRDVKFTIDHLAIRELPSPYRERIDTIPTRLTLERTQIDDTIEGARQGTLALRGLRNYLRERIPPR